MTEELDNVIGNSRSLAHKKLLVNVNMKVNTVTDTNSDPGLSYQLKDIRKNANEIKSINDLVTTWKAYNTVSVRVSTEWIKSQQDQNNQNSNVPIHNGGERKNWNNEVETVLELLSTITDSVGDFDADSPASLILLSEMIIDLTELDKLFLRFRQDHFKLTTTVWKRIIKLYKRFKHLNRNQSSCKNHNSLSLNGEKTDQKEDGFDLCRLVLPILERMEDALTTLTLSLAFRLSQSSDSTNQDKNVPRSMMASVKLLKFFTNQLCWVLKLDAVSPSTATSPSETILSESKSGCESFTQKTKGYSAIMKRIASVMVSMRNSIAPKSCKDKTEGFLPHHDRDKVRQLLDGPMNSLMKAVALSCCSVINSGIAPSGYRSSSFFLPVEGFLFALLESDNYFLCVTFLLHVREGNKSEIGGSKATTGDCFGEVFRVFILLLEKNTYWVLQLCKQKSESFKTLVRMVSDSLQYDSKGEVISLLLLGCTSANAAVGTLFSNIWSEIYRLRCQNAENGTTYDIMLCTLVEAVLNGHINNSLKHIARNGETNGNYVSASYECSRLLSTLRQILRVCSHPDISPSSDIFPSLHRHIYQKLPANCLLRHILTGDKAKERTSNTIPVVWSFEAIGVSSVLSGLSDLFTCSEEIQELGTRVGKSIIPCLFQSMEKQHEATIDTENQNRLIEIRCYLVISFLHFLRFMSNSSGRASIPSEINSLFFKMLEEVQNKGNRLLSYDSGKTICLEVVNSYALCPTLCKRLNTQQVFVLIQAGIRFFHTFRLDENEVSSEGKEKQDILGREQEQDREYVLDVLCNVFHNISVCVKEWSNSTSEGCSPSPADVLNLLKMLVLKLMCNQYVLHSQFLSTKIFYYLEIFMKNNPQLSDLSTYVPAKHKSGFVDYLRNKKMSEQGDFNYQYELLNDPNVDLRAKCAKRRELLKRKWENLEPETKILDRLFEYGPSLNAVAESTRQGKSDTNVVPNGCRMSNQVAEETLRMFQNVASSLKEFNAAEIKNQLLARERTVILRETQKINVFLQAIMHELSS